MGLYCVGTIQTNRLGYCKEIICKKKRDQKTRIVVLVRFRSLRMYRAYNMLDGLRVKLDQVVRKDKTGEQQKVVARCIIKDYHKFMGSVDVHAQLRLHRHSIQRSITLAVHACTSLSLFSTFWENCSYITLLACIIHSRPV
ncbi:hypothetical protein PHMEG_00019986 [Phytophthora megakarya]|uniref:Uncharacterized protein n=1 Tax=Phytophthora megakarya TaxID=4795 RepID=A0A225VQ93_9STRA|nr:hypothetical protein PHMEG_00019986 [Phytophthora megakarya]